MTDVAIKPFADEAPDDDAVAPAGAHIASPETVEADAVETAEADAIEDAEADAAATADASVTDGETGDMTPGDGDGSLYAWAPAEPQPKKKRTALWIGIGAGAAATALVASSLILIAPGTAVAGVSIGWLTPGAAADVIQQRLAETTVVLTGDGGDVEVTGADLGASVGARDLAEAAFADHPMWNPTTWFAPSIDAPVKLDAEAAVHALRAVAPELYTDPVDAVLAFDPATATYVVTPAVLGTGIDIAAVQDALQQAFEDGQSRVEFDPVAADVEAAITTATAEETAAQLNTMLDTVGFYVGEERTVPVDRAVAASWLTVTPDHDAGRFEITADAGAIQAVVDTLPDAVNRAPENARVITDSAGKVLREEAPGQSGRELGDTQDVASDFAAQLGEGNAAFQLPVTEVPVTTVSIARRIEVDLGDQRTYLFENGNLVNSYAISSGLADTPTFTGHFRVFAHTRMQDMGCFEGAPYCTENVPWVTWFNGDQAFHGAYWHNNFGNRMSHGCVNMPVSVAKFLYDWAPVGTEVWVHH